MTTLQEIKPGDGFKYFENDTRNTFIAFKLASKPINNDGCVVNTIKSYFIMHPLKMVHKIETPDKYNSLSSRYETANELQDCNGYIIWPGYEFGRSQRLLVTDHKIKSAIIVADIDYDYKYLNNNTSVWSIGQIAQYNPINEIPRYKSKGCPNCSSDQLTINVDGSMDYDLTYICNNCGCQINISISK